MRLGSLITSFYIGFLNILFVNGEKMYRPKLEDRNCRICLEESAELDWNRCLNDHETLTYKDCYYKYTQLDISDEENLHLPTIICRSCSENLKNINAFVSKALEIHDLLNESIVFKCENDELKTNFETILLSESEIKLEELDDSNEAESTNIYVEKPKEHELQNDKIFKKKSSKPWEIPTCCSICSKVLSSKYHAIEHERTHMENRERNETCEECGMKFYNKNALRIHKRTHIKNREKTKKCDFCDKAFYDTGALNIHRRIHLGQMVKCPLCTKEYYRQVDLDKHMLSHSTTKISGELKSRKKYFVCCELCGDNVRSVYYKSHIAKHNNEPLAKCAICNKEFFGRSSCFTHVKSVHRKGSGETSNFVISYKTTHYSNLFLQQKAAKLFIAE